MEEEKKSIPEQFRERYSNEELIGFKNRGEMAKKWEQDPYSKLILDGFVGVISEFELRKNSLQLKSFLFQGGHDILTNMIADEEAIETYKSIIEGVSMDIRYGVYAEQALSISVKK